MSAIFCEHKALRSFALSGLKGKATLDAFSFIKNFADNEFVRSQKIL